MTGPARPCSTFTYYYRLWHHHGLGRSIYYSNYIINTTNISKLICDGAVGIIIHCNYALKNSNNNNDAGEIYR